LRSRGKRRKEQKWTGKEVLRGEGVSVNDKKIVTGSEEDEWRAGR